MNSGSIYLRSPRLESPYNINSLVSLEQALPKGWRFAASADTTRGVHVVRTRNINAPFPGTPLPDDLLARLNSADPNVRAAARTQVDQLRPYYPVAGNLYQFESSAISSSKNFTIRLYTPTIGLPGTPGTLYLGHFAFGGTLAYTRGYSYDDLGTAPNQYDFSREWARSQFDQRNRIQAQFQIRPTATVGLVSFNISSSSGRPYSLTTGRDDNGDQSFTDRPAGVGRNTLTSPGTYNVDVTWTKIKTLKAESRTSLPASDVGAASGHWRWRWRQSGRPCQFCRSPRDLAAYCQESFEQHSGPVSQRYPDVASFRKGSQFCGWTRYDRGIEFQFLKLIGLGEYNRHYTPVSPNPGLFCQSACR